MAKLWNKGLPVDKQVEKFTVGNDYMLDKKLLKYDCIASIAHAKMLSKIGLLKQDECNKLVSCLNEIIKLGDKFKIEIEDEDCHTAIENYLVNKLGGLGKKIHTGRSRNDQVLTALRLYEKESLSEIKEKLNSFIKALDSAIKKYGKTKFPGYTHMQRAMPTTIKMWLESFLDAAKDNISMIDAAIKLIDQNPLGSAAGFGVSSFNLDRNMTAKELGFSKVMQPMYCQLSRGKFEANIVHALSQIMFDLNKIATDMITFSMKEFGFISLPKEFCTGSSIMPQKNNPDVLELIRAKYHVVVGEEIKIKCIIGSLISGYHRDFQLTKEPVINSFEIVNDSLIMLTQVISGMNLNEDKCKQAMTPELYATEEAYKLVKQGMPFRDAYKKVAEKFK